MTAKKDGGSDWRVLEFYSGIGSMSIISHASDSITTKSDDHNDQPAKVQVAGWPPIQSLRKKNSLQQKKGDGVGIYIKVSMAGAPYLRKIDLKVYRSYPQLLNALQNLLKCAFGRRWWWACPSNHIAKGPVAGHEVISWL